MQPDDTYVHVKREQYDRRGRERERDMVYVSGTSVLYAFGGFIFLVLMVILLVLVGRTNELLRNLLIHKLSISKLHRVSNR